jgi:hypothetical protein
MTSRPHRFLQYLQELSTSGRWHEVAALEGNAAGGRRAVGTVEVVAPGRSLREIQRGIRLVLKWSVRALYLSPLLILARSVLRRAVDTAAGDMATVVFVVLVVGFFVLLNLYIVWSVIVHFRSTGRLAVRPPFGDAGEDRTGRFPHGAAGASNAGGPGAIRVRGVVAHVEPPVHGSVDVVRDLWVIEGRAPWRLTEAADFAVLVEGERPVVVQLATAPVLIGVPARVAVVDGVERMSPGLNAVFDMAPALEVPRAGSEGQWLALAAGDEVELVGTVHGALADVGRFELGEKVCSLQREGRTAAAPYRGAAGEPGTLVVATPETPVWIRRL